MISQLMTSYLTKKCLVVYFTPINVSSAQQVQTKIIYPAQVSICVVFGLGFEVRFFSQKCFLSGYERRVLIQQIL